MILIIIKLIFLTVSWSLGWRIIISDGMLFEKIGKWAEQKSENNKLFDLVICPWCIPNAHGILFVWPLAFGLEIISFEWDWVYVFMYPFCLGASSFITGMLWSFYLSMNAKKEYHESGKAFYDNAQEFYYLTNKKIKNEKRENSGKK